MMSASRSRIAFILRDCLGHVVDTFRELQFCTANDIFCSIDEMVTAAGKLPAITWLGDRGLGDLGGLVRVHVFSYLGFVKVQDVQGDLLGQTEILPVVTILGMHVDCELVDIHPGADEVVGGNPFTFLDQSVQDGA